MINKKKYLKTLLYVTVIAILFIYLSNPLVAIQGMDSTTGALIDTTLQFQPPLEKVASPGTGAVGPVLYDISGLPKVVKISAKAKGYEPKEQKLLLVPGFTYTVKLDPFKG